MTVVSLYSIKAELNMISYFQFHSLYIFELLEVITVHTVSISDPITFNCQGPLIDVAIKIDVINLECFILKFTIQMF